MGDCQLCGIGEGGKEVYSTVVSYQEKKNTHNRKDIAINDRYFLKGSLKKLNNYISDAQIPKQKRAGEHKMKYKMVEVLSPH